MGGVLKINRSQYRQ